MSDKGALEGCMSFFRYPKKGMKWQASSSYFMFIKGGKKARKKGSL
jgi:hypothetical protein